MCSIRGAAEGGVLAGSVHPPSIKAVQKALGSICEAGKREAKLLSVQASLLQLQEQERHESVTVLAAAEAQLPLAAQQLAVAEQQQQQAGVEQAQQQAAAEDPGLLQLQQRIQEQAARTLQRYTALNFNRGTGLERLVGASRRMAGAVAASKQ
jgi:hypothetical protein